MSGECGVDCAKLTQSLKVRGVDLGQGIKERIETGSVNEERINNYEKEWRQKVECLDDMHTQLNNLTVNEADRIIQKLAEFAMGGTKPACPSQKDKVFTCLKKNKTNTLKCNDEVENFVHCVDEMLIEASHKLCSTVPETKKLSYTEKFQQVDF